MPLKAYAYAYLQFCTTPVCTINRRHKFPGCGGKQVHQLDGTTWKSVIDLNITMPAKTLVYGEVIALPP